MGYSVALSGSGFLFPVHCGALEALTTLGTVDELVGTSGGSLVSAAWAATGGDWQRLKTLVIHTDFSFAMPLGPLSIWRVLTTGAASTNKGLLKWMQALGGDWPSIPLTFLVTDCRTWRTVPLVKGCGLTLAEAAVASAAIPLVYPPFRGVYQDGGVLDNLGVNFLRGPTKIAVRLIEARGGVTDYSPVSDALGAVGAMLSKIESLEVNAAKGILHVPVDVQGFSFMNASFTPEQKEILWLKGYNAVVQRLKEQPLGA